MYIYIYVCRIDNIGFDVVCIVLSTLPFAIDVMCKSIAPKPIHIQKQWSRIMAISSEIRGFLSFPTKEAWLQRDVVVFSMLVIEVVVKTRLFTRRMLSKSSKSRTIEEDKIH